MPQKFASAMFSLLPVPDVGVMDFVVVVPVTEVAVEEINVVVEEIDVNVSVVEVVLPQSRPPVLDPPGGRPHSSMTEVKLNSLEKSRAPPRSIMMVAPC